MEQLSLGRFQLFSPLSDERYQALKSAIAKDGVLVAVEIDQNGQVLDGHHRIKAWNELRAEGVKVADYPRMIRTFDNDDDREEHAAKLNAHRRDVSTENKKRNALRWRQRGWPYRRIADALAVNHETIRRWMPEEESGVARATPEHPTRVTGADGKSYAATKPKPAVMATSAKEQERALDALDDLDGDEFISTATGEIVTSKDVQRAAKNRHRDDTEKQAKSEQAKSDSYMEVVGDPNGNVARARLLNQFSSIRTSIYDRLLPLNVEAVATTLDERDAEFTRRFIVDCRSWLDDLEGELSGGIRLIRRKDAS
jgi:ParB-like chromosome segregation protein Spo0J